MSVTLECCKSYRGGTHHLDATNGACLVGTVRMFFDQVVLDSLLCTTCTAAMMTIE
jgi:hypothetical protein